MQVPNLRGLPRPEDRNLVLNDRLCPKCHSLRLCPKNMNDGSKFLISIGGILLVGLLTDAVGKRTPLPRVTLLVMFGYVVGPDALDLLPPVIEGSFDLLTKMALVMVGFLMGGQFTRRTLRRNGRPIFSISVCVVVVTVFVVWLALLACGVPPAIAILLAGIATATDPAATADVVRESHAKGPFARTLLGVVAIDDVWGLVAFSLCLSVATAIAGVSGGTQPLLVAVYEIGGAILLGICLGFPSAWLSGRLESGEPTLTEAVGIVFLCGGIAIWLNVSWLLASTVLGAVVVNVARHHRRPFHEIENVEWPFMILFFVLAGASLKMSVLSDVTMIAVVYVVARITGRIFGGWVGAFIGGSDHNVRRWMGLSLLPQAGVALGMALVAAERITGAKQSVITVIIATTIVFELAGPLCTRYALTRGETSP